MIMCVILGGVVAIVLLALIAWMLGDELDSPYRRY
jgi:hypothetical protein